MEKTKIFVREKCLDMLSHQSILNPEVLLYVVWLWYGKEKQLHSKCMWLISFE